MSEEATDKSKSNAVLIAPEQRQTLKRYFRIERNDVSAEDDTVVQMAAASEYPVLIRAEAVHVRLGIAKKEGDDVIEILSHEEGDYDLARFNNGNHAPLLDEHFNRRHLGYIIRGAVGKDKVTRIAAKFDLKTKLSKVRHAQVISDSRPNASIGYAYTKYIGTRQLDDGRVGHVFGWEGLETSNVGVPADPSVGRNRAAKNPKCVECGDTFERSELNEEMVCADCDAAETPAEERAADKQVRSAEDWAKELWPPCGIMTRKKKDDAPLEMQSHKDIEMAVTSAAHGHKDLKHTDENGNKHSDFHVHDIHSAKTNDGCIYVAYIAGPHSGPPDYKREVLETPVEYDPKTKKAKLGPMTPVEQRSEWAPVERGLTDRMSRAAVDFKKSSDGSVPTILIKTSKNMADEPKITPELVIDHLDNEHVRSAIAKKGYILDTEIKAAAKTRTDKLAARNTEILALETEFSRDFGTLIAHRSIAGGKKEPLYLRDGIHIAAMEACALGDDKSDSEVRQIFRSKVDDLKRDAVKEETITRAMDIAELGFAGRCGDMFETVKRTLADSEKSGIRSTSLMPTGAEAEYNEERKRFFRNLPGTSRMAELGGFFTPETKGRKAATRQTRDALAGDFATAGALIAPQFHPYIELLRNKIVMSNLGATYIGGCMGEQVFPRQEAATIAQSLPEGGQLNPYDQQLGQIKMGPHRVGSRQFYSRLALIQAPPDFESMVWNDHSSVLALYQDEMAINGSGAADQPIGILNQPGINQLIFGGTPTYQSILNFRTNIRKFNIDGPLAFTTTSVGQGRLAYLPAALNGSTVITQGELDALWKGDEIDGEMLGCKAIASQQIPGDILLAGVFEHMMIANWGGIFTIVDNYTRADRDEVAITFNTYFDIAVRHAQAFTRSMDSVNQ